MDRALRSLPPRLRADRAALDLAERGVRYGVGIVGLPCRTGESVISVDGDGTVRRCHFVRTELGNLYDGSYRSALRPRPCPLAVCDCHIGFVHLETLPLYDEFAGGVLERVPAGYGGPARLSVRPRATRSP
ncbi:hypothetical protein ACE1SV_61120 [Streptomyces sp. E-15]